MYDDGKSFFTNVGYSRSSNFQIEYRDVDSQNSAQLGSTLQFVIPKAADLLGCVDLMLEFAKPPAEGQLATRVTSEGTTTTSTYDTDYGAFLVEAAGFAVIEKATLSVGSHDIETLTGDQMYIMNELMRNDEHRYSDKLIGKTGRPAASYFPVATKANTVINRSRAIATFQNNGSNGGTVASTARGHKTTIHSHTNHDKGRQLCIPLAFFFTKNPGQYFPLCAIAGCNDIRISVKLRKAEEIVLLKGLPTVSSAVLTKDTNATGFTSAQEKACVDNCKLNHSMCKLRCHYVHVTGPEATQLMNKEHVRLLKLWQPHTVQKAISPESGITPYSDWNKGKGQPLFDIELPFLHPVQELIFVIRKCSDMNDSTDTAVAPNSTDKKATGKNYYAFHGSGTEPNIEYEHKSIMNGRGLSGSATTQDDANECTLQVEGIELRLNGQERQPSLAGEGLSREYLMERLMPMMHSNTSNQHRVPPEMDDFTAAPSLTTTGTGIAASYTAPTAVLTANNTPQQIAAFTHYTAATVNQVAAGEVKDYVEMAIRKVGTANVTDPTTTGDVGTAPSSSAAIAYRRQMAELYDRKEIYVYPFALNPEGHNPSGSVNFSKVSHAKLKITGHVKAPAGDSTRYQLDVWGVHYNWLAIKDGRAITSFA